MKKIIIGLLILLLWLGAAAAEDDSILGKPFPDFTVTDTEGNTFTLSEALKNHEAVLINLWATWCGPCEAEFPDLNEACKEYGDRVAFIALSGTNTDTIKKIESYRRGHGITFPMGRDEGARLLNYTDSDGIPVTIIVDRFGNAAFLRTGSFNNAGEVKRVLEFFLGKAYVATKVLENIPAEASVTRAFPMSAKRALHVENENAKPVLFHISGFPNPFTFYVIPDDTAHLRLEITAAVEPENMVYVDGYRGMILTLAELLDPEKNTYVCEQPMPGAAGGGHFLYACLMDAMSADDPDIIETYLITDDRYIEECAEEIRSLGFEVSWEYGENKQDAAAPQAYILHAEDQYGAPVGGVTVSFCTDTACVTAEGDENGTVTFSGTPGKYHVQLLEVPDGYSFDEGFGFDTGDTYGEWMLRIRKD